MKKKRVMLIIGILMIYTIAIVMVLHGPIWIGLPAFLLLMVTVALLAMALIELGLGALNRLLDPLLVGTRWE